MGYFKEEGLNVSVEAADGSSFVVQQISAGKAPVGNAVTEPELLGYAQNPTFVSFYDFLTGNGFDLWVRDDSSIQSLKDIPKGSKVAIKDDKGGDIPRLNVELQKAGLNPGSDIQYNQFGENAALGADMLAKKQVAALEVSWNSMVGIKVALEKQGVKVRCITCNSEDAYAGESMIVTKDFLSKNKKAVEGIGRALAKATLFGQTNPEALTAIMKTINPEEQSDPEYTKAYIEAAIEIMKPRQPKDQYGWQDPAAYQRNVDLLLDPSIPQGLSKPVDLNAFIDNSMVDAFNDFDHDAVVKQAKEWKAS
jgi:NitT/TauT family transport system substrate-binding protein